MSDFKAKMHQIQFLRGSAPDPTMAAYSYSTPPDHLAVFKWTILLRGGRGRAGEGIAAVVGYL